LNFNKTLHRDRPKINSKFELKTKFEKRSVKVNSNWTLRKPWKVVDIKSVPNWNCTVTGQKQVQNEFEEDTEKW
jgi:hypothetical protein